MAKKIDNQEKLTKLANTAIRKFGKVAYVTPEGVAVRGEFSYLYVGVRYAQCPVEFAAGLEFSTRDLPDVAYRVDMDAKQIAFGAIMRKATRLSEFPLPDLRYGQMAIVPSRIYADIEAVLPACALEDIRPTLRRVVVQFANGFYLRAIGADGYRLALRGDERTKEDETVLIEPEIARFLASKAVDRNGDLYLLQKGAQTGFLVRLVDGREALLACAGDLGKYPNVIDLIPQECAVWALIDGEKVGAAIKESYPIWSAADNVVEMQMNGTLGVRAVSQERGIYHTEMPYFGMAGAAACTRVNARYLQAALGGRTAIGLNKRYEPIVFMPEDGTLWVVMPMSVR